MAFPLPIAHRHWRQTYDRMQRLLSADPAQMIDALVQASQKTAHPLSQSGLMKVGHRLTTHDHVKEYIEKTWGHGGAAQLALMLIDQLLRNLITSGKTLNEPLAKYLEAATFTTNDALVTITVDEDFTWSATWELQTAGGSPGDPTTVRLAIYSGNLNWIVPQYVAHNIAAGIQAYVAGMDVPAISLMSIAVEATLRDVLGFYGYKYEHGIARFPTYEQIEAEISVDLPNSCYIVSFTGQPLTPHKPLQPFAAATQGTGKLAIKLRREQNSDHEFSLRVKALDQTQSPDLIDFWSTRKQTKQPYNPDNVTGLEVAFRIARDKGYTTPEDLPKDLDPVIAGIRNGLIHLSGTSLKRSVQDLEGAFNQLQAFLNQRAQVEDLIFRVPYFVNGQYQKLRKEQVAGTATSTTTSAGSSTSAVTQAHGSAQQTGSS